MAERTSEIAVLFLHHFGGSSWTWNEVIARLPGIRCIAPDLRGFGASGGSHSTYHFTDYVSDVHRLVAASEVARLVLVGHSMGGKIAMAAAAEGLAGVEALVLFAPSPPTPEPISDAARTRLASTLERGAGAEVVMGATGQPLPARLFKRAVADVQSSAPGAWRAWLEEGSRRDISAAVDRIRIPTMVFSGTLDKSIPPEVVKKEVVGRISGAVFSVITDAGHLLPLESPAAVADAVRVVVNSRVARQAALKNLEREPKGKSASDATLTYPRGFVHELLKTDAVTNATRSVLTARVAPVAMADPPYFTSSEFETLKSVCDRLIRQPAYRPTIEIAALVDERLARGMGNGWRYAAMPPDGEFYRRCLHALNETATASFGSAFSSIEGEWQDQVLLAIQYGHVKGELWVGLSAPRFFEELLAEIAEIYYSHPIVQDEIGYAGMADAKGWARIGLNQLEDIEPRSKEAPCA